MPGGMPQGVSRRSGPIDCTASRRTALGLGAAAALAAPWPAVAISKKAAESKALMRETAKEQAEALKEYKFAPRPELNDDGTFKESTLKAGSTGELASYYKQKGAVLQVSSPVQLRSVSPPSCLCERPVTHACNRGSM